MWPYYLQSQPAPLPYVFEQVGLPVAKMIITIGAIAGLTTSLLGALYPLPRIQYAMASDGLVFRFLADVNPRFKTPLKATVISGIFAGFMAALFNIEGESEVVSRSIEIISIFLILPSNAFNLFPMPSKHVDHSELGELHIIVNRLALRFSSSILFFDSLLRF